MKGYSFRLQKLLDIREKKEEESKMKFKQAQMEKNHTEEKLFNLENNYNKYNNINLNDSILEKKIRHSYLNSLNFCINETANELQQKLRVVEERREELKTKQVERKTVEILKEKDKLAFEKEQNMIEQRNNDEFALYAFIRNTERR
ncbi:flagellar export protein FliJ [Clostridium sporogenes]|jgi:flagellar FliJ protein|uniref:Flagellar FliJ protein n=2 Tax=Clostridium TaxID=1485 RepID=A0A0D1A0Y4_CLOBO|nr:MULTISPECIES: flagellar export protein FliJ [Clostridium]MBE6077711.1 flagellar export protein FliJ [Clostridium lundense]MDU1320471.1 flagellar export protein FliJ [Clostridium botulinum]EDU36179.1 flagellar export protein FliJ [Clostridium sporogenes ATCC 15579]KIS24468.1 flagellar biosynthesis protein FliJ [Clostridium botulinum B2 450]MCW6094178.1 flagellar export protein FliJ [Clostridium sporogenes]